jgi:hypothetical protein
MDVAQAAAIVMTEPGHQDATYELVGTHGLSQSEVVGILSHCLNRSVTIKVIPLSEWEAQARIRGLGDYQIQALTRMFCYYEQYGFSGNPRVLNWLLQHPPSTLEIFIERTIQQS